MFREEGKVKLKTREIRFNSASDAITLDNATLRNWREYIYTSEKAAKKLSENNGIKPALTVEEFIDVAHRLGHWR